MKLNEKIKEYRKIFNLSQEQLAEKLSVSRQVITKWENDEGLPEIGNLKAISKIMGISIDYLLDETKKLEYPLKRRCIRCNIEMIENFDIKIEGAGYGIKLTQQPHTTTYNTNKYSTPSSITHNYHLIHISRYSHLQTQHITNLY